MPIIENLDFSGDSGNGSLQYIPEVSSSDPPPPGSSPLDFSDQKNSSSIDMDFSTPIHDVMPSAAFDDSDAPASSGNGGAYKSPTTNRVTGISPGMIQGGGGDSKSKLTKEQLHAIVAGAAAVIAFSKPVQSRLSTMVPKFLNEAGDLSITGMLVSAVVAAIVFYFANQFLQNQS